MWLLGNVCFPLKLLKLFNPISSLPNFFFFFGLVDGCILSLPLLQVNSCAGKMGKAVIKAADSAGLHLIPMSFGCAEEAGKTVEVCGKEIKVHGPSDRESVLASVFREHPNMIVVDYTVPDAVNST